MNVLVTGGAGYIGSHTSKALAQAGFVPIVYDNLSAGHEWSVQWGPLVVGDINNRALLIRTIRKYEIEAVCHLAAHAYVGESVTNPRKYYQNNLVGSLTLLDAMVDSGVRRLVFSSTCATYGAPRTLPIDETHSQAPVNPYGETKLAIERALRWYGEAFGLEWAVLRYFNAAGADPDGEIGEQHDPESHLIPLAIEAAITQATPIAIFGIDYPTPDGTAIRDYIHVTDLARGHVCALSYLEHGGESNSFNLGLGAGHSVREIISSVGRVTGRRISVLECRRRAGDPAVLVACAARARATLGWCPQLLSLDEIVNTAWQWRGSRGGALGHPRPLQVSR